MLGGLTVWVFRPTPAASSNEVESQIASVDAGESADVAEPVAVPEAAAEAESEGVTESVAEAVAEEPLLAEAEPRPTPARRTARMTASPVRVPVDVPQGRLVINTMPWSDVYLDNERYLGTTPLLSVRVPAGAHVLTFRLADGSSEDMAIEIEEGETAGASRRFTVRRSTDEDEE